jgi:N-acetylglucosamine-6-phosphate deacetylase
MTSIRASKVVTPEKVILNGVLVFDDVSGLITDIVEDQNFDADLSTDAVLIPGFVDIHCHGGGGFSFDDSMNAATAAEYHLSHGTTSVLASLVSAPVSKQVALLSELASLVENEVIAGIHLEGPFLSSAKCGAQNPTFLTSPDAESVKSIISSANGNLKMITIAPELDGALAATKEFVKNDVVVALGHSDATSEIAIAATDAGASVVTHLFNAMRPLHHRDSGLADVALTDSRLFVELITDGKHVGDLSISLAQTAKKRQFIAVTDAMSAAGMPDGEYKLGGLTVTCEDDVAVIAGTTTLAGSTLNMERIFERLLNVYNFDVVEACWATATAPAKAVGLFDVGSIEVGKRCNFVLWKDGIKAVYKNGNLVRQN